MTREDLQQAILDWLQPASGLPREKIIFLDQRGDRPDKPYAAIKLISGPKVFGHDDQRAPDPGMTDDFLISGQRQYLCSVNVYSSLNPDDKYTGPGANQIMSDVRDSLEKITVYTALNNAGLGMTNRPAVQNLTQLLEDQWEERAQMDVEFCIASNIGDSPGTITKVKVSGTVSGQVGNTGIVTVGPEVDKP